MGSEWRRLEAVWGHEVRWKEKTVEIAFNVAGMCENNWGQPVGHVRRKWIYLHPDLLNSSEQLLPLILNPRLRN